MLPTRAFQPFESLILVPAIRVHFGDLVCRRFRKIPAQLRKRGVCFRDFFLAPACARHNQKPRPITRVSLRRGCCLLEFALQQIRQPETGVRPGRRWIQLYHARKFCARFCESFRRRQVKSEKCSCLWVRSEEHTSELQSHVNLVCRLLLEKKKKINYTIFFHKKNKKKNKTTS